MKKQEQKKEELIKEIHHYHYIPYPVYQYPYPWYPKWPVYPQYPISPIWQYEPKQFTWTVTATSNGTTTNGNN